MNDLNAKPMIMRGPAFARTGMIKDVGLPRHHYKQTAIYSYCHLNDVNEITTFYSAV